MPANQADKSNGWVSINVADPGKGRRCCAVRLFEAGRFAARRTSPYHAYYEQVARRVGKQRAALSVARKLARRCHHRLRALGDDAFAPVA